MPHSANFSVQNAPKLTYKHPEIKKKKKLGSLSLVIKGRKGEEREGKGRGGRKGREERRKAAGRPRPPSFLTDRRPWEGV
jgi:hypothetical protein